MRLTDPEDGVLVATQRHAAPNGGGPGQLDRDLGGDAADHPAPTDDPGDGFLIDAVLQRDHEAVGRQMLLDQQGRPAGIEGFHGHEGDVDRPGAGQTLHVGDVQRTGRCVETLGLSHAGQSEPVSVDRVDIGGPAVDQHNVMSRAREISPHIGADGPRSHDRDAHLGQSSVDVCWVKICELRTDDRRRRWSAGASPAARRGSRSAPGAGCSGCPRPPACPADIRRGR